MNFDIQDFPCLIDLHLKNGHVQFLKILWTYLVYFCIYYSSDLKQHVNRDEAWNQNIRRDVKGELLKMNIVIGNYFRYGQQQNPFEGIIRWRWCLNDHKQGWDAKWGKSMAVAVDDEMNVQLICVFF
jgi:predicted acetyltransferase